MSFSVGSGGGASSISTSTDVALNIPASNQVLGFDAGLAKWKNVNPEVVILYWDTVNRVWPARPDVAAGQVEYRSTTDTTADAPLTALDGDVWERRI